MVALLSTGLVIGALLSTQTSFCVTHLDNRCLLLPIAPTSRLTCFCLQVPLKRNPTIHICLWAYFPLIYLCWLCSHTLPHQHYYSIVYSHVCYSSYKQKSQPQNSKKLQIPLFPSRNITSAAVASLCSDVWVSHDSVTVSYVHNCRKQSG